MLLSNIINDKMEEVGLPIGRLQVMQSLNIYYHPVGRQVKLY